MFQRHFEARITFLPSSFYDSIHQHTQRSIDQRRSLHSIRQRVCCQGVIWVIRLDLDEFRPQNLVFTSSIAGALDLLLFILCYKFTLYIWRTHWARGSYGVYNGVIHCDDLDFPFLFLSGVSTSIARSGNVLVILQLFCLSQSLFTVNYLTSVRHKRSIWEDFFHLRFLVFMRKGLMRARAFWICTKILHRRIKGWWWLKSILALKEIKWVGFFFLLDTT